MIAIIGADGEAGKRYQAILSYLYQPFVALDRSHMLEEALLEQARAADRIIIASPTHTHIQYLRDLLPSRKPILCEMPVTKNLEELEELNAYCARSGFSYQMVFQFKELEIGERGETRYDYFNHGKDGLLWDCLQIVSLAKGRVVLNDKSPVWKCQVNGTKLNFQDLDQAYVSMIQRWIAGTLDQSIDEIFRAHAKVAEFEEMARYEMANHAATN